VSCCIGPLRLITRESCIFFLNVLSVCPEGGARLHVAVVPHDNYDVQR
jgi:hypothetical protein